MNENLIQKLKGIITDMSKDMIIEVIDYAEYLQNKDSNIKDIVKRILRDTEINWNKQEKTEVELEEEFERIEDIADYFSYTFLLECIRQDIQTELNNNYKCIIKEKKKELLKIREYEYNFFVFFDVDIYDLDRKKNTYSGRAVMIVNIFQEDNIIIINKIEIPEINS